MAVKFLSSSQSMTLEEARRIAPEYNPNGGMVKARYETGEDMLRYLDAVSVIDEAFASGEFDGISNSGQN